MKNILVFSSGVFVGYAVSISSVFLVEHKNNNMIIDRMTKCAGELSYLYNSINKELNNIDSIIKTIVPSDVEIDLDE